MTCNWNSADELLLSSTETAFVNINSNKQAILTEDYSKNLFIGKNVKFSEIESVKLFGMLLPFTYYYFKYISNKFSNRFSN